MKNLPTIGKYLLIVPLAVFGLFHFVAAKDMAGVVPGYIPGGIIWVYLTGAAFFAAVIAIFIGKKAKLAAELTGLMILLFAIMINLPSGLGGNDMAMGTFLKELVMVGGLWIYSGKLSN